MEPPLAILDRLPHRAPFRFVTRVDQWEAGVRGCAVWELSGTEDFFAGHFPGQPIVPGVLLGEALAQLSGLVGCRPGHARARLAHIDLKFLAPVVPPARVTLHSRLARTMGSLMLFEVTAEVAQRVASKGQLSLVTEPGDTP